MANKRLTKIELEKYVNMSDSEWENLSEYGNEDSDEYRPSENSSDSEDSNEVSDNEGQGNTAKYSKFIFQEIIHFVF